MIPQDLGIAKSAVTNLIPEKGDRWIAELLEAEDLHPLLKSGIMSADATIRGLFEKRKSSALSWEELADPVREHLYLCCQHAMLGGRAYADSYKTDFTKTAQIFDWDITSDIDQMITGMGFVANKKAADLVHEALMTALPPPIHELSQMMKFEQAKAIARTVMMNVYTKAALRRFHEDGIFMVKRIEMRDKKTCPLCRALNGKQYSVLDLLGRIYPLTEDSHQNCRGSFLPLISLATYSPKKREIPLAVDFKAGESTAKNVPIEIRPWLASFLRKFPEKIEVEFDPTIEDAYSWSEDKITINPGALVDQDAREIVLEAVAENKWDAKKEAFETQYIALINRGLAHPAKSFVTSRELFVNNYVQYRMGQDEDPWSIHWWKTNVG